jgi:hypothetical protein
MAICGSGRSASKPVDRRDGAHNSSIFVHFIPTHTGWRLRALVELQVDSAKIAVDCSFAFTESGTNVFGHVPK